jgi:DNA polymerase (family 10)
MTTNAEIAAIFEGLAALLERKKDSIFKIRAYRRVAQVIEEIPFSLEERVAQGADLRDIPSIGEAIDKKIREYISTGSVQTYERLKAELGEE